MKSLSFEIKLDLVMLAVEAIHHLSKLSFLDLLDKLKLHLCQIYNSLIKI